MRATIRMCYRPGCGEAPAFRIRSDSGNLYEVCAPHLGVTLLHLPNGLPARIDRAPEDPPTARHEIPR